MPHKKPKPPKKTTKKTPAPLDPPTGADISSHPVLRREYARQYASPLMQNATAVMGLKYKEEPLDYALFVEELRIQTRALKAGDVTRAEEMLLCQAHTLDRLFCRLLSNGIGSAGLAQFKIKLDLALKAQRQCRATLETLAAIKNPQPYVKQQNVAYNQQVNNGTAPAREKSETTNGLLEDKRHESKWVDAGAAQTAGRIDKNMETVGTLHGAENA